MALRALCPAGSTFQQARQIYDADYISSLFPPPVPRRSDSCCASDFPTTDSPKAHQLATDGTPVSRATGSIPPESAAKYVVPKPSLVDQAKAATKSLARQSYAIDTLKVKLSAATEGNVALRAENAQLVRQVTELDLQNTFLSARVSLRPDDVLQKYVDWLGNVSDALVTYCVEAERASSRLSKLPSQCDPPFEPALVFVDVQTQRESHEVTQLALPCDAPIFVVDVSCVPSGSKSEAPALFCDTSDEALPDVPTSYTDYEPSLTPYSDGGCFLPDVPQLANDDRSDLIDAWLDATQHLSIGQLSGGSIDQQSGNSETLPSVLVPAFQPTVSHARPGPETPPNTRALNGVSFVPQKTLQYALLNFAYDPGVPSSAMALATQLSAFFGTQEHLSAFFGTQEHVLEEILSHYLQDIHIHPYQDHEALRLQDALGFFIYHLANLRVVVYKKSRWDINTWVKNMMETAYVTACSNSLCYSIHGDRFSLRTQTDSLHFGDMISLSILKAHGINYHRKKGTLPLS
jgi:hypothetical protein